ncbi:hypothetical protein CSA37_02230 [Candidatus Fermentibacteria bacterium]|nr:MAG: hypothetical protein CSA37_02230 [Candidatus Fermentibacteria bacterium]
MDKALTLKVLIVDDEDGMRSGIKRALRKFKVTTDNDQEVTLELYEEPSGEDAIDHIKQHQPDLMLLDNMMGGMSGIEVLQWIDGNAPDIMVIMITAYASIETAITATKQGAFDFLPKPFTPGELKVSVRQAVLHLMALRQARALESEKRRVRFQFISVLAHELKAPLGAIEGYLYLLRDGTGMNDPEVYRKVVDRSLIRLTGMRKLIYDLLDLTRLESGQKKRELKDTDLIEVTEMSIETMKPDADQRNITITANTPEKLHLNADRSELEIILNNMISNAVKYNRDNGTVTIDITEENNIITISVSDTGIGMTEEEVNKLFGEFVRIKNEKTKNILGSGLGLSILRKTTALYGGKVSVKSKPDAGTTFTVTLDRNYKDEEQEQ